MTPLAEANQFCEKARAWLTLVGVPANPGPRLFSLAGSPVVVAEWVNCPAGFRLAETLLVRRDFASGADSEFSGWVYAGGNAALGKSTRAEALRAGGECVLGIGARVRRWLSAEGAIDLRASSWVEGLASSSKAIRLGQNAGAQAMVAPEISTYGKLSGWAPPARVSDCLVAGPPYERRPPMFGGVRGFREEKLTALGADTWVYDGSLALNEPLWLRSKLVVRGSFTAAAGSLIEEDIKCGGTMRIGRGSIVRGNLVARGEMVLEGDVVFDGELDAGLGLRLSSGVRGIGVAGPVRVRSKERVRIEPNVVLRGMVSATLGIRAVEPEVEGGLELLLAEG